MGILFRDGRAGVIRIDLNLTLLKFKELNYELLQLLSTEDCSVNILRP